MIKRLLKTSGLKISVLIAFLFLLLSIVQEGGRFEFIETLEYLALDTMFLVRGKVEQSGDVVIIAVDEKSINQRGRWPWPRNVVARLVDKLREAKVKVLGFDIVFSEVDHNSTGILIDEMRDQFRKNGLTADEIAAKKAQIDAVKAALAKAIKEDKESKKGKNKDKDGDGVESKALKSVRAKLAAMEKDLDALVTGSNAFKAYVDEEFSRANQDITLTRSLKQAHEAGTKIVLGYFFFSKKEELETLNVDTLAQNAEYIRPASIKALRTGPGAAFDRFWTPKGIMPNIPMISESSPMQGYFNFLPDHDGVFRRNRLFMHYTHGPDDEALYPSLALQSLAAYFGEEVQLEVNTPNLEQETGINTRLSIGEKTIPVNDLGAFMIKYYGPSRTFKHISATDILDGKVPQKELEGRLALIGATAVGVYDIRHTPFDALFPGIEIHANVCENVIHQDYLTRPTIMQAVEVLLIMLLGVVMGIFLSRIKLQYGLLLTIVTTSVFLAVNYYGFFLNGIWIKMATPMIEIYTIFVALGVYRYMTEEREKAKTRKAFQSYMSPQVVEQVLQNPDRLKLGGEDREITVLFSDVRGFTTISEKLTPQQLVYLLNDYLSPMTDIVFETEGTLDKYIGDALMAFWGAPLDQPDHRSRACRAALLMLKKLHQLQPKWRAEGFPEVDIGVGLNSGIMTAGNMGSNVRFDYTIMGDNVNLGSRLEGITKQYHTKIIISEFTQSGIDPNEFLFRDIDLVAVKGKAKPVKIYELMAFTAEASEEFKRAKADFERGIELYRAQKWDEAEAVFKGILAYRPDDGVAETYVERVEEWRQHPPPPDWNGVWVFKTK